MPDLAPNQTPKKEQDSIWKRTINLVTYPFSAIAGFYVGDMFARKFAYKNLARHKYFDPFQKKEQKAIFEAAEKALGGEANFAKEMEGIQAAYRSEVREVFRGLGLKNSLDYWKLLHRNQKVEALAYGMTVTGVGIGALHSIHDHLGRIKDSIDPNDRIEASFGRD